MSTLTTHRMAALIGAALEDRGMSQAQFCRMAGVSTKHLNAVLLGKAAAPLSKLDYWAYLLGCRFDVSLVDCPDAPDRQP